MAIGNRQLSRWAPWALLALSSCAGGPQLGATAPVECAPFARALTGVALYGPADGWWRLAAGRYRRDATPSAGSVLVFSRSRRLPYGHVSVVSIVVSSRRILLTQANWLHGRIGRDQPAIDVSVANDWTAVRVFWPPSDQIGMTVYPAYGFIVPDAPPSRADISAGVPGAIRVAEQGSQ